MEKSYPSENVSEIDLQTPTIERKKIKKKTYKTKPELDIDHNLCIFNVTRVPLIFETNSPLSYREKMLRGGGDLV